MAVDSVLELDYAESSAPVRSSPDEDRRERIIRENLEFVWRLARHWGLSRADADDVAQRVMMVVADRACDIEPGKERAFLFRTTLYATRKHQRGWLRRREVLTEDFALEAARHPAPDELLEKQRASAELHQVLQRLPDKPRQVFVLFELEGWTVSEIGEALGLSPGTIASRLRQARAKFLRHSTTLQRKMKG